MSLHIGAKNGEIADTVLLPGDPLRARFIAETYFENPVCYNEVRGMYGFTGTYKGKQISVQGTGMGVPSISIYVHELLTEYDVKTVMRVGTCGSIHPDLRVRDLILAMAACSDSNINNLRFPGKNFSPIADYELLRRADELARQKGVKANVGNIFTTDSFYHDDQNYWKQWADFGILGLEMESTALYTLAAKFHARALSILTVSDDLVREEAASSEERQNSFRQMIDLALEVAVQG